MSRRSLVACVLFVASGCAGAPTPVVVEAEAESELEVGEEERTTSTADEAPSTDIYLGRLDARGEVWVLSEVRNITARPGYDNQPHFGAGETVLYTSVRAGQSDIYAYGIETGRHEQLTATSSNEYSPTPFPGVEGAAAVGVSVVRELGGVQELWHHGGAKGPRRLFSSLDRIGYHLWLGGPDEAVFFLVGESEAEHELVRAKDPGTELVSIARGGVGRCLAALPGEEAISYVAHSEAGSFIMRYALDTGEREVIVEARAGAEDYAWTAESGETASNLLMGEGSGLWRWSEGARWREVELRAAEASALPSGRITRIAVSQDQRWVAFVEADAVP